MILLTGLVSFITSVATGIITVALVQESPQTVTQTVNRVVEKTIERVVPEPAPLNETKDEKPPEPVTVTREVTKEVTVFAKEDDLLVAAVEKNQARTGSIYPVNAATGSRSLGSGFVVSRDGLFVTTPENLLLDGVQPSGYAVEINGVVYPAKPVEVKGISKAIAFLMLDLGGKTIDAVAFVKAEPRRGQTVAVLHGDGGIFKTTLSRIVIDGDGSTTSPNVQSSIEVTPRIPDGNIGALVINLDGATVGMAVWNDAAAKTIVLPGARIYEAVSVAAGGEVQGAATTTAAVQQNPGPGAITS